ncbi:DNA primase / helicase [Synechococcus phage S-CRM01]|uniref:DNA primase / helicase n=1 Tax=Synechococcus phage S-CRM01 TaxID=1026955 RepID=UPI000209E3DB|nr:DNA primase / helicase [Synechococcus phage S-CRM01]AEC53084.1 DNA primase / helicase [Synechococcus phage S-CRM01]
MTSQLEITILKGLLNDETYTRKVLPYIEDVYFTSSEGRKVFDICKQHFSQYDQLPTAEVLAIEVEQLKGYSKPEFSAICDVCSSITTKSSVEYSTDWLIDETERWCKERAVYLALLEAISIHDGNVKDKGPESIPDLLSEALSVGFDDHVGHDYLEDYEQRYEFYHTTEERVPMGLTYFDKITKGGLPKKTLTVCMAGTNVGKSLFMCSVAGSMLENGYNVLYITLEMAEEKIAERIDANLINISLDDIGGVPKSNFVNKIKLIKQKTCGKLFIKEYPTASAHVGHFESLLKELSIKKSFKPDIIFIDYLNICSSVRYRAGANVNSYTMVKSIAEEIRGLAVKHKVPIVSATQTNRTGFTSSDPGLENTSESFGLPATADFMFSMTTDEQLEQLGQLMVKQLKNRFATKQTLKRFVVGVDYSKMRLYDVEQSAQEDIIDDVVPTKTFGSSKFTDFDYD